MRVDAGSGAARPTGCGDPWFELDALVRTDAWRGGDVRPVEGAKLAFLCEGHEQPLGETDADGRLASGGGGSLAPQCRIRVEHPDEHPQVFQPAEPCAMSDLLIDCVTCHAMAVDAAWCLALRADPR